MSGFLSFLPDLFGSAFETAAESAPATLSAADFGAALPAASDFGLGALGGFGTGFGEAGALPMATLPGADYTPFATMGGINPLAMPMSGVPPLDSGAGGIDYESGGALKTATSAPLAGPAAGGDALAGAGDWQDAPGAKTGLFGGASQFLEDHPLLAKSLLPAGAIGLGLARNAMAKPPPGLGAIKDIASQQAATAAQLSAPLLKGAPLPSGMQAQIDQAKEANKANIRQQYGNMGLSGSTMEAEAMQKAETEAIKMTAQQAMALYGASAQALGISSQMDMEIMKQALMQDQQVAQLLGGVAQAAMYGAVK